MQSQLSMPCRVIVSGASLAATLVLSACSSQSDATPNPSSGAQSGAAAQAPQDGGANSDAGIASGASNGGVSGAADEGGAVAANEASDLTSPDASMGADAASVGDATGAGDTADATPEASIAKTGDASLGDGGGAPLTVYIAGDSTVSQYVFPPGDAKPWAGWGQMLAPHFNSKVTVKDDAVGGRTAFRFIQEGHLDAIWAVIKPGDYLLVQFGTNDSNTTATYTFNNVTYPYYAAPGGEFTTAMKMYVDGAHTRGAIPVLVTPPPRNSAYCHGPRGLANYGQAMIDLGKSDNAAVVDLGLKAYTYLTAICPAPTSAAQENFFKLDPTRANGIDGTHFQENGARILANFVADGITEDGLGLAAYRVQ